MENPRNPFLNHLIIDKIISYTNRLAELRALRLLSSQWNERATPKLLKSSIVNLKCQREMDLYVKHFRGSVPHWNFHWKAAGIDVTREDSLLKRVLGGAEELHISKGLMTMADLGDILQGGENLRTLSLNEVFVDVDWGKSEEEQKRDLAIKEESSLPERTLLEVVDPGRMITNNLCRLEVTSCDKDDNFPWNAVFLTLPQLRVLHAQLHSSPQVTRLLESMRKNDLKLEEFSCFLVDMTEEQLQLLSCLKMPLKILDISLSSAVTNGTVEGLLSAELCKKLENLKLFKEADCGHKNYFGLPKLLSLHHLEILGDPVAKILKTVQSSCPNLESLNLSELSCRDVMSQNFQHFNLKSICIEECFFPSTVLTKLTETFPCVTNLCLFLNDDTVGIVFQKCENLEELTILGTEISDDGITGGRQHPETNSDRPYVGDCKKLRTVNLFPQPLPGITDASIHCGFVFVSELTSLSLPETAISDRGLRCLIRVKPHLVKLHAKVWIDVTCQEYFLRATKYQIL